MGVIYPGAEIMERLAEHSELAEHQRAAESLITALPELPGVVLVVEHGSVPEQRFNTRSDLDLLATYFSNSYEAEPFVIDSITDTIERVHASTGVHIEPNIWPAEEHAKSKKARMYDGLFVRHLYDSMQNPEWSTGEHDQAIAELDAAFDGMEFDELRTIVLGYLVYKHNGFTKAPTHYDGREKSLAVFQRALEFPGSTKRKVLQLEELSGVDLGAFGRYFSAGEYEENIQGLRALDDLITLNSEYTRVLEDTIAGGRPKKSVIRQYNDWLESSYVQARRLALISSSAFKEHVAHLEA